jgi:hypothetical protein
MERRNPVYPFYFADPFVWKIDGEYFAVGTGPIAEKETAGETDFSSYQMGDRHLAFPLLRSPDLFNWRLVGGAVDVPETFRGGMFWAPEVAYDGEKFYIYYSVAKKGIEHQLRVASSESPTGPYMDEGALLPETDKCPFHSRTSMDNGIFFMRATFWIMGKASAPEPLWWWIVSWT